MKKIKQHHETYLKESLSHKQVAIDALKENLPKELLARIDLESLERINERFIDEFFPYYDDVTYKAKIDGKEGLIYFLIELQRINDHLVAFRRFCHLISLLQTYMKQNKQAKQLPLVLPICLHKGQVQHSSSTSVYDCFDNPAIARKLKLCEQPLLININR